MGHRLDFSRPDLFHTLQHLHISHTRLSWSGGGGLVTKSCLTLVTPWTVARQAPLSMGFSRQEYWSGLSFPSPGDLPNPGIEPGSPALQADSWRESWDGNVYARNSCMWTRLSRKSHSTNTSLIIASFISPSW